MADGACDLGCPTLPARKGAALETHTGAIHRASCPHKAGTGHTIRGCWTGRMTHLHPSPVLIYTPLLAPRPVSVGGGGHTVPQSRPLGAFRPRTQQQVWTQPRLLCYLAVRPAQPLTVSQPRAPHCRMGSQISPGKARTWRGTTRRRGSVSCAEPSPTARRAPRLSPVVGSPRLLYPLPQPHFLLHFGYFLGAFKLNSRSKFHWQNVPRDRSTSICCLSPLAATYTDANPILSRS